LTSLFDWEVPSRRDDVETLQEDKGSNVARLTKIGTSETTTVNTNPTAE